MHATTTTTATLHSIETKSTASFRPRISRERLQQLISSANETHTRYKNGCLVKKSPPKKTVVHPSSPTNTRKTTSVEFCPHSPASSNNSVGTASTSASSLSSSTSGSVIANTKKRPRISRRLRQEIVASISRNRLTIIHGPAGCGKSTQIPQLLLQEFEDEPILCTQPHRLAVASIAKQVTSELGLQLGSNKLVSTHNVLGKSHCHSTHHSQLIFTTSGILLENLRTNGWKALSRYRFLLIDECHERSPESDLVLALIRDYFECHPHSPLRLLLMSATFPHQRYERYFANVPGCKLVDTIALESPESFSTYYNQVETFYLDDILPKLPPTHAAFGRKMRINPDSELAGNSLSAAMLSLITSLVAWLNRAEPVSRSFLIFAPTFRHLQQIHQILQQQQTKSYSFHILHSSVDLDDCLESLQVRSSPTRRRIVLANAIAESSVTVPDVSCVIDLCRMLEFKWDSEHSEYKAWTAWAPKSVCDQRSGRTGRTCAGRVFRLLPKGFYLSRLLQWNVPQLTLGSCRDEVLGLVHSSLSDAPGNFLGACLDAPQPTNVQRAVEYLVDIGAINRPHQEEREQGDNSRSDQRFAQKLEPTRFGAILAALPLSVEDAKIVLAGAQLGLLFETLVIRLIYNHEPAPICHNFANPTHNRSVMESFWRGTTRENDFYLAQFSAYMFWDAEWNFKRRSQCDKALWAATAKEADHLNPNKSDGQWTPNKSWEWTPQVEEDHKRWCKSYNINPSAVRSISEKIEQAMNVLYLNEFMPEWLKCGSLTPAWRRREGWKWSSHDGEKDMLYRVYGADAPAMSEALLRLLENNLVDAAKHISQMKRDKGRKSFVCIHYLSGNCLYGDRCFYSHDPSARRPRCRFYKAGTCNLRNCQYAHEESESYYCVPVKQEGMNLLKARTPALPFMNVIPKEWFRQNHRNLLMIGEGNFTFSQSLGQLGMAPFLSSDLDNDPSERSERRLHCVDGTRLHADERIIHHVQNSNLDRFAWNFPSIGDDSDDLAHEILLLETFHSLALLKSKIAAPIRWIFGVTLREDELSRWNVAQSAWKVGWRLKAWSTFDHCEFPGYSPSQKNERAMNVERSQFYVFELEGSL